LANLQLDQFGTYDEPLQSIPFPSCKGYLLSNGKHQSGDKTRTLRETIPRQQIKQYMQERHDWDKETFNKVNLDAYAAARRSNRRLERFSTRFAHNRDSRHLVPRHGYLRSPLSMPPPQSWRGEFLERLEKHLMDSATEPNVKEEVLECTTSWLHQTTCPCKCDQLRIGRHLLI
jgi:hypothetical protein